MKKYPGVSEVFKKKERHRRTLAALPFEEKIEMVFKLRERRKFIKSGRDISNGRRHETKPTTSEETKKGMRR